jgi:hypothetical protein
MTIGLENRASNFAIKPFVASAIQHKTKHDKGNL